MNFSLLLPARIEFGRGAANAAPETLSRFSRRIVVVRSRSATARFDLASAVASLGVEVATIEVKGEPTLAGLTEALPMCRGFRPDAVVAIGGGSALDMGKALAALSPAPGEPLDYLEVVGKGKTLDVAPLPFVAIPTTAGTGAEATKNAVIGVEDAGRKVSLRDDRMLARLAIVDPGLTDGLPRSVTLASGLDAVTQVIEPYLSRGANPLTDALCRDAIPRGLAALVALMRGESTTARDDMALVSLTGGIALANAGLGAVHALAGPLGGRFNAPHGAVCGRLLAPILTACERAAEPDTRTARRCHEVKVWIAGALGTATEEAFGALDAWTGDAGLPRLRDMGVPATSHDAIARDAQRSSSMKGSPIDLSADDLMAALQAAD